MFVGSSNGCMSHNYEELHCKLHLYIHTYTHDTKILNWSEIRSIKKIWSLFCLDQLLLGMGPTLGRGLILPITLHYSKLTFHSPEGISCKFFLVKDGTSSNLSLRRSHACCTVSVCSFFCAPVLLCLKTLFPWRYTPFLALTPFLPLLHRSLSLGMWGEI